MQTDRKFHAIFIKADGSDVCVSMKAVMHVLAKHRVKPRRGRWEIKLWMVDEMAAFDKEHGIPRHGPTSSKMCAGWVRGIHRSIRVRTIGR